MARQSVGYRLSDDPQSFGLSCTERGLSLAGVPLLTRSAGRFAPRSVDEVRWLIDCAYQATIDARGLMGGLNAVAHALNEGALSRAMLGALLLKLPDLDWDGAVRIAQAESALIKAGFDPNEARDARGRWTTGDVSALKPANDHLRAPGRANTSSLDHRAPLLPSEGGDADLLDVGLNSAFHDEIRDALADHLRLDGLIVETEVTLLLDGTDMVARTDILAMKPGDPSTLSIVEVKTGLSCRLSDGQSWVYPAFVHGGIVSGVDSKIASFGFTPGAPLPPASATIWYEASPSSGRILIPVPQVFPFKWQAP